MPSIEYLEKHVYSSPGMYVNDDTKKQRYDSMIDHIQELLPPPANILDYGSGIGVLSKKLSSIGYNVSCYEPSQYARDISEYSLTTYSKIEEIPRSFFSMVIAIEVLEHCIQPAMEVSVIYDCLADNGIFYYTTGFMDDLYRLVKYVQPEQHLNFFTKKSAETMLSNVGFEFNYHDGMVFPIGVKNV